MGRIVTKAGSSSSSGGLPAFGTAGQVLQVNTDASGSEWADPIWTHIATGPFNSTSTIEFLNLGTGFTSYQAIFDSLQPQTSIQLRCRLYHSGSTLLTSNQYGWGMHYGRSSSNSYTYSNGQDYWYLTENGNEHAFTGYCMFSAFEAGKKATFSSNIGSGTSTQDPGKYTTGGVCGYTTNAISGIKFYASVGAFTAGKIKLFGMK